MTDATGVPDEAPPLVLALGPMAVRRGDEVKTLRGQQAAVLGALSAAYPDQVTVDGLIDHVWGHAETQSARAGLAVVISRLRTRFDQPDAVVYESEGYRLGVRRNELDLTLVEDLLRAADRLPNGPGAGFGDHEQRLAVLRSALACFRGDPFGSQGEHDALRGVARRFENLRLDAEEHVVDCLLDLGRADEATVMATDLVDRDPYRERRWAQLMLALYRTGRQAEALRTMARARGVLRDDLGIDPGTDLRLLETRILDQDPALDGPSVPVRIETEALTSRPRPSSSVPRAITSFIGRDGDLDEIARRVSPSRCVTIVGPPGVGKTRLAQEYAADVTERRVLWIDLTAVTDGGVIVELARAAGARLPNPGDPSDMGALVGVLDDHPTTIVFDNCEHVAAETGSLVDRLAQARTRVEMLATSRVALQAAAEDSYDLDPLAPDAGLRLLQDRMKRRPWPDEMKALASLVAAADRLPLVIELAAGVLDSTVLESTPDAARADGSGTEGPLDVAAVRAVLLDGDGLAGNPIELVFERSLSLLPPPVQDLFDALGVIDGPFSVADVVALLEQPGDEVLSGLDILRQNHLLSVSGDRSGTSFRLLESCRLFATARLRRTGRLDPLRRRNLHRCVALVAHAAEQLIGPREAETVRLLHRVRTQLNAAFAYAAAEGATDELVGLAVPLVDHIFLRQEWDRFGWLDVVLAAPGFNERDDHAEIVGLASFLAWARGHHDRADELCRQALDQAEKGGRPVPLKALQARFNLASTSGDLESAGAALSLRLDESTRRRAVVDQIDSLVVMVLAMTQLGAPDTAASFLAQAEEVAGETGCPSLLSWVEFAAGVAALDGDAVEAARRLAGAVRLADPVENHWVVGLAKQILAVLMRRRESGDHGQRLLWEAAELWNRLGAEPQLGAACRDAALVFNSRGDGVRCERAMILAAHCPSRLPILADESARYDALMESYALELAVSEAERVPDIGRALVDLLAAD